MGEVNAMVNETPVGSALASFVLRIALGAIFMYHGATKIWTEGNEWGALWATKLWLQQNSFPASLRARLEKLAQSDKYSKEEQQAIREVEAQLAASYADEGSMPQTLRYHATQLAVAWGELAGGAALLIGVLTRLSALAMIVIQVGAIWTVTLSRGFSFTSGGGYEYNLALLAMCLAVAILGAGALSVDRCWSRSRQRRAETPQLVKV
jgi:putative oxidoreductase